MTSDRAEARSDTATVDAVQTRLNVETALAGGLRDALGNPAPTERQEILQVLQAAPAAHMPYVTAERLKSVACRSARAHARHLELVDTAEYDPDKRLHELRESVLEFDD